MNDSTPPPGAVPAPGQRPRYPGRAELDAADSHLRRTVSRLARQKDPATAAKAGPLVAEAAAALYAVAAKANAAIAESPTHQAAMRRADRKLARAVDRLGPGSAGR
ncbi:hypothetical protein [Streptomyces chryseus]